MNQDALNRLCQRYNALVLAVDETAIHIAVVGSPAQELMEALRFATQKHIDIECWSAERFEKQQRLETPSGSSLLAEENGNATERVNHILQQALSRRASDIHIEPGETACRIRLRIDGVLQSLTPLPVETGLTLTARLKVLGKLDIAERRLPQDGQFTIELEGKNVSFRLSTLPSRHGEKVVLRVLQQTEQALEVEALGMSAQQQACFSQALNCPQGLILVTGPTGSGKTVTLYSALGALNNPQVNLCSVEDPVEIPLPGLNQTQINPKAGLTFQRVLRALLRQDPDIIMIGEIRDGETAEIAIKAAQTGHLVLSTLHTNSTSDTLVRLEQMGVPRWMLTSALQLVIAQRLVRKLCSCCRSALPEPLRLPAGLFPRPLPQWQANGCERCYSGFYGRLALFELLPVNAALRQAMLEGLPAREIEALARQQGMISLFESGCLAVEEGLTTIEEIYRVLGFPDG
ncbi:type II secretion system protein GspE [Franconibacter pulveris]